MNSWRSTLPSAVLTAFSLLLLALLLLALVPLALLPLALLPLVSESAYASPRGSAHGSDDKRAIFDKAMGYVYSNHNDAALPVFNTLVQSLDKSDQATRLKYAVVFLRRARCLEKLGRYQAAAVDVKSFSALQPLCRWSCGLSGRILAEAQQFKDAIATADKYIFAIQNHAPPFALRAACYAALADYTASTNNITEAVKLNFNAHDREIRLEPFCSDETLELFDKRFLAANRKDPQAPGPYFGRGVIHLLQQQYKTGIEELTASLRLKPAFWQAQVVRANCRLAMNDLKGALKDINSAIEINPNEPASYATLERYYLLSSNLDAIFPDLNLRLKQNPRSTALWIAQAHAYAHLRDSTKELDAYAKALGIDHGCADAVMGQGRVYQQLSEYTKAIDCFTSAIKLQPKNYEIYKERASCYFAVQDYKRATSDLTKVIELAPDPHAYSARAQCYASLGRLDFAEQDKQKAKQNEGQLD